MRPIYRKIGANNLSNVAVPFALSGYWGLNQDCVNFDTNVASDLVPGGNNGTMNNFTTASYAVGQIGSALTFNGSSTFIDMGNVLNITTDMTMMGWAFLRTSFANGFQAIFGKWQDAGGVGSRSYLLCFGSPGAGKDGAIAFFDDGASAVAAISTSAQSTFAGAWHHFAGRFTDADNLIYLFVDGQQNQTAAFASATLNSNARNVYIGDHTSNTAFFDGQLQDIRIYNRSLTNDEITQIYLAGTRGLRDYGQRMVGVAGI